MSLPTRLLLALQQIDFDDGFEFERFANAFLAPEIPELRPVAGMHDGARDAFIYSTERVPGTFVQASVTPAFAKKIRKTVRDLKDNGHAVRELLYCTSQDIQAKPDTDTLRRALRTEGVALDIRDQNYFVTFCNVDAGRIAASEDLAKRYADPLLATRSALEPSALALTDEEQRAASAFFALELSTKDPGKAPTKFAYEALVHYALRAASPETPLPRQQVHEFVARFVDLTEPARVILLTDAAISRLVERDAVKHHKKADAFTLSYTQREQLAASVQSQLIEKGAVRQEVAQRAVAVADQLGVDFDYDASAVADDALALADYRIASRGQSEALALVRQGAIFPHSESLTRTAEKLAVNDPDRFRSLGALGLERFVDLVPAVLEDVVRAPSERISKRLLSAGDAYFLMFALRQTPDVHKALEKLFHGARLIVDTSLIIPCLAERLLPERERRVTTLLRLAAESGVRMVVGDDVLNEIETHLDRVSYAYHKYTQREVDRFGASTTGAYQSLLVSSYLRATGPTKPPTFAGFIELFKGKEDPKADLIDFLKYELSVEYDDLGNERTSVSAARVEEVFEKWTEFKRKREWMDDRAFETLVLHDARTFALVEALRGKEKGAGDRYGHRWWWLTMDGTAYRVDIASRAGRGASLCVSPDFFSRYLSMRPSTTVSERELRQRLPVSVELASLGLVPGELRKQASQLIESVQGDPEYLRRRKLREMVNRAFAARGEFAESRSIDED